MITINVNGSPRQVDADPEVPLLWALRDHLGTTSVKYTCGIAECGICTVLVDGEAQRSCIVNLGDVQGRDITTIEGLPEDHPVKLAWIEKQVPQCGYCQPGIMLQTVDLLARVPNPTEEQIDDAMDNLICRCGSHPKIKTAIQYAAAMTARKGG
jgi:isoquinoline 1-oxidoreductase alpha subunit